jgi:hypothetical protein
MDEIRYCSFIQPVCITLSCMISVGFQFSLLLARARAPVRAGAQAGLGRSSRRYPALPTGRAEPLLLTLLRAPSPIQGLVPVGLGFDVAIKFAVDVDKPWPSGRLICRIQFMPPSPPLAPAVTATPAPGYPIRGRSAGAGPRV